VARPASPDERRFDGDSGVARYPDRSGLARSPDGTGIAWDVYGDGSPTILLLPSSPIIHARQWKGQIHYLSRHFRVVAFDGRGNGRSDRPTDPAAYASEAILDDLRTVLDATDTPSAVFVGLCGDGVWRSIQLAAIEPERVLGIVAFGTGVPLLTPPHPWRVQYDFDAELPTEEGWAKVNRHYWERDYAGFARFFFEEMAPEPHSTKVIEDAARWTVEGSMEAMLADMMGRGGDDLASVEATCRAVRCPMLLIHGTDDRCQPLARAQRLAELTGAPLVTVDGGGHLIPGRFPVRSNLLIRDFVRGLPAKDGAPAGGATRAPGR